MNLFAYGTLMWPEVLKSVIGRQLEGTPVTLQGYRRLRIKGEQYPAVIPATGDEVGGILYTDLSASEFLHLDRFEGEEYDRVAVRIDGTEANLYVLAEGWLHIADDQIWLPEQMSPDHLAAFCNEYKGWAK